MAATIAVLKFAGCNSTWVYAGGLEASQHSAVQPLELTCLHYVMHLCTAKVRRLAEAAGLSVTALKRVRVGGLRLPRDLAIGEYRSLSPHEIRRAVAASM